MLYLVDGYNVAMSDPATRTACAEDQRAALVRRLCVRGHLLLGPGRVVVVFDGRDDGRTPGGSGVVDVRFSQDRSADDAIVELAGRSREPVTLVTDDRSLAERALALASVELSVLPPATLFDAAPGRRRAKRYPAASTGLPKGANRITEELKGLWLDDEE